MTGLDMTSSDTPTSPGIVWFRNDLRLADQPALTAAVERGGPVLCLFIHDEDSPRLRPLGGASKWWLGSSLAALDKALAAKGTRLVIMRGPAQTVIDEIVALTGAGAVFWTRRYGAEERGIDATIKASLKARGITASTFNGQLLNEPWEVTTKIGGPVKVFTPYWRAARARGEPAAPLPVPKRIIPAALPPALEAKALAIADLGFEPTRPDWAGGMRAEWQPGEVGAAMRLEAFLDHALNGYGENRNLPDHTSTSKLSPHLRFGEISPRQIWHAAHSAFLAGRTGAPQADLDKFLAEIGWREFAHHLLFHNPDLARTNYNPRFNAFPWAQDDKARRAWEAGQTGYPMVDAGLRELWTTGWMHNRVRMIVASFLVKHLLLPWQDGERWFWDTLVDACPANNAASWQWVAGSGADAAPYFRIFNPFGQGEKFDTAGDYVRKWVPELARLPAKLIHRPWEAPPALLLAAGVKLGSNYPRPVVEHDKARERALAAFSALKPNGS
jgi:deoxyribodipyrimidine photo-lyase